jgi:biotin transporter BioY
MYIIAIAWIYVAFLMAVSETSLVAGVMTFIFYGLLPCALLLWILGAPQRKRNKKNKPDID